MIIIKDIQYITDIEKLKVISDPLRISILTTLGTEKKNSKELAKLLKINIILSFADVLLIQSVML
mgnify:CR=1 FL=1